MSVDSTRHGNVIQAVPFFMVRNISASMSYNVDGLGFAATRTSIDGGVDLFHLPQRPRGLSRVTARRIQASRPQVGKGWCATGVPEETVFSD
jgi:hypothetical protein